MAVAGKHMWIFADKHIIDSCSPFEVRSCSPFEVRYSLRSNSSTRTTPYMHACAWPCGIDPNFFIFPLNTRVFKFVCLGIYSYLIAFFGLQHGDGWHAQFSTGIRVCFFFFPLQNLCRATRGTFSGLNPIPNGTIPYGFGPLGFSLRTLLYRPQTHPLGLEWGCLFGLWVKVSSLS